MSSSTFPMPSPRAECRAPDELSLVVVGSSLGGPAALTELFAALGSGFHVPIVVVQHAPASVARPLVSRLSRACPLDVVVAEDRMPLVGGRIHVAPGGRHVVVEGAHLRWREGPPEHGCRPSVDVLFRSVLTGMGSDGLSGARTLRRAGARILAQDAQSSAVWGMAGQVVRAGLADAVGAPSHLGALLDGWSVRHRLLRRRHRRSA